MPMISSGETAKTADGTNPLELFDGSGSLATNVWIICEPVGRQKLFSTNSGETWCAFPPDRASVEIKIKPGELERVLLKCVEDQDSPAVIRGAYAWAT